MSTSPPDHQQDQRTWTLDLPWSSPPLSLNNSRRNHYAHARLVKKVRALVRGLAIDAGIPALDRCAIELHYVPRDSRRRDPHNFVPTLKPCEDGIVDAGVVPDDTPQYVPPSTPVVHEPSGALGRLYVVVRELTAEPAA